VPTTPKLPLKLHERLGDDAMTELLTLFGDLGAESRAAFQELRDAVSRLEKELDAVKHQIADLKPHIANAQAELIKWTFLFWLGTIGIVLLLIRFPR
jgi:phage-related minor tail protein